MIEDKLTETINGAVYEVGNTLGCGFLEKVYENALFYELQSKGLNVKQQWPIDVFYKKNKVGEYVADLLVEDKVIIELKAVKEINDVNKAQVINYLKATNLETGLLINYGNPKTEIKRLFNKPVSKNKYIP